MSLKYEPSSEPLQIPRAAVAAARLDGRELGSLHFLRLRTPLDLAGTLLDSNWYQHF